MRTAEDISGRVFGRLTVICRVKHSGKGVRWFCKCSCGNEKQVAGNHLRSGSTVSCGCHAAESTSSRSFIHGRTKSTEYKSWSAMKQRCTNTRNAEFYLYGGRGVSVCNRWIDSFENFIKDMGNKPKGMSLDRIDTNGNYCPENCRWATDEQQNNNTRKNKFITHEGKTLSHTQWSKLLGGNPNLVYLRIREGWDDMSAVTTPVNR